MSVTVMLERKMNQISSVQFAATSVLLFSPGHINSHDSVVFIAPLPRFTPSRPSDWCRTGLLIISLFPFNSLSGLSDLLTRTPVMGLWKLTHRPCNGMNHRYSGLLTSSVGDAIILWWGEFYKHRQDSLGLSVCVCVCVCGEEVPRSITVTGCGLLGELRESYWLFSCLFTETAVHWAEGGGVSVQCLWRTSAPPETAWPTFSLRHSRVHQKQNCFLLHSYCIKYKRVKLLC